jgi:hypothetical protein
MSRFDADTAEPPEPELPEPDELFELGAQPAAKAISPAAAGMVSRRRRQLRIARSAIM